jgi:hypothetical protein
VNRRCVRYLSPRTVTGLDLADAGHAREAVAKSYIRNNCLAEVNKNLLGRMLYGKGRLVVTD